MPHRAIQLIAIDVDGTLLTTRKKLSKRTVLAIKKAGQLGVRVILASARPPRSTREIYQVLGLNTWQINYNGALIHDALSQAHVFHQPLAATIARKVVDTAREVDRSVVVSIEILDKWYTDYVDDKLPTETSRTFKPDFIGPLDEFLKVPVTKVMLLAPPARITGIRSAVEQKCGERIGIAVSDPHLVQVLHPEVDKSKALKKIADHYHIKREQVMTIGDAPNDVGMLKWAGLGVAVGNAWPETRRAADVVVPANDDDGVAHAIEEFVLKPKT